MNKPELVTEEHLQWLDAVRESGSVNMYGVAPDLADSFGLSKVEARQVLRYWMESFGERHSVKRGDKC